MSRRTPPAERSGRGGVGDVLAAGVLVVSAFKTSTDDSPRPRPDPDQLPPPATDGGVVQRMLGRVDAVQRRRPALAIPIATMRRFGEDKGGRQAALIAYYGFFSLFPAMLAMVTILGFVLQGHEQLGKDIADSALAQFPIVGDQIAESSSVQSGLTGNGVALVVGLLGALWAGLGAMQAAQDAMNHVWRVQHDTEPSFLVKRLRSMLMLIVIGALVITSTALAQLAGQLVPGVWASIGLTIASGAWNVAVFAVAYRLLTVRDVTWRDVLPGAVFTGVAYTVLQLFGGVYVAHVLTGASNTYGTFAVVIGLLSWIFLIAQVTVIGAELNAVVANHEWPKPLRKAATRAKA